MKDPTKSEAFNALVRSHSATDCGEHFCAALKDFPPEERIPDCYFDEDYIRKVGAAFYRAIVDDNGNRRTPSKIKHRLQSEANQLYRSKDWRGKNKGLAWYFAKLFEYAAAQVPPGKVGNKRGVARSPERFFVEQAYQHLTEEFCSAGYQESEVKKALLKPGIWSDGTRYEPGQPSPGRSILEKIACAVALKCGRELNPKKVKQAKKDFAKSEMRELDLG